MKNVDGNLTNYNENTLASNSHYIHENVNYAIPVVNFSNGNAYFDIPRPLFNSVMVYLSFTDKSDHYLPYQRNFKISNQT